MIASLTQHTFRSAPVRPRDHRQRLPAAHHPSAAASSAAAASASSAASAARLGLGPASACLAFAYDVLHVLASMRARLSCEG